MIHRTVKPLPVGDICYTYPPFSRGGGEQSEPGGLSSHMKQCNSMQNLEFMQSLLKHFSYIYIVAVSL